MGDPLNDIETLIRKVAVLKPATDEDVRVIARLGILRAVEEGAYFFFQGELADHLYIMKDGRAKLCQISPDGQQVNLRTLVPGQLFGAVGAVEPGATYPACAQALEDSTAVAIESTAFRRVLETRPQLSLSMMRLMTGYIREIQERYRELATERVDKRIALALLRLAAQYGRKGEQGLLIELSFSREDLAEMTGTTLYTVSRTLSTWEKRGIIKTGRERIILPDPHDLVRLAEDLE